MSITSGPIVPLYTGSSTFGLPLLNDRVALVSASFMSVPSIEIGCRRSARAQELQQLADLGAVELAPRFAADEQQVEQVIVGQLHQLLEHHRLPRGDGLAMAG